LLLGVEISALGAFPAGRAGVPQGQDRDEGADRTEDAGDHAAEEDAEEVPEDEAADAGEASHGAPAGLLAEDDGALALGALAHLDLVVPAAARTDGARELAQSGAAIRALVDGGFHDGLLPGGVYPMDSELH